MALIKKKRIVVSVISDLVTDQRVHRTCQYLHDKGLDVLLIGRLKKDSLEMQPRDYKFIRINPWFQKGVLMYAMFNIKLFFKLAFKKWDMLWANDLDTLLPNFILAKTGQKPIVYDSHEYFTAVPELENRPLVKGVWKTIESFCLKRLQFAITVNSSIADIYHREYGLEMKVLRNIPPYVEVVDDINWPFEIPMNHKVLLVQGAGINIDRGIEEMVTAMNYIKNAVLVIIGGGDVLDQLKNQVRTENLDTKVFFIPKVPLQTLKAYSKKADIGLSLDKDTNLNYRFSLPNKLFDYLHAGLAVVCTNLPEVSKVVKQNSVGIIIKDNSPESIATAVNELLANPDQLKIYRDNALNAAKELNWQGECRVIDSLNLF